MGTLLPDLSTKPVKLPKRVPDKRGTKPETVLGK
jgi:hypothetical protein